MSQDETVAFISEAFPTSDILPVALKMVRNTEVITRRLSRPLSEIATRSDFCARNTSYINKARALAVLAARQAMDNAGIKPSEVHMVIATSCTGFSMPSLTAMLINDLALSVNTQQLPIAQLGCSAGVAAINIAANHCRAYKNHNVLVVSAELCSYLYHPDDNLLASMVSASLFGDAVAATVVRGVSGRGFAIKKSHSIFLKDTENYIAYDIRDSGFYFRLDKEVMHSIKKVAPGIERFIHEHDDSFSGNKFYVVHTGGKRILDEVVNSLGLNETDIEHSRTSLALRGNLSSASVMDVLKRTFDGQKISPGQSGVMIAFGPGFTTEMSVGYWV
ncbi:type III polyketide synthase [Pseudomonas marginalis]|uniref:type III polyketide synthase n=1 Tax=Pseudomonas marginalis TaxID=298 RepID=UPI003BA36843